MAIGKSYVGTKNFKIRPNSFYVEKQVDVGVALSSEHRDFAQSIDEGYKLVSGIKVPAVVLSGNVNTKESVKEGDYALMGGFLRTFVSGVTINNARGKPPVLEAYTTNSPYPITEGGMTFAKNRLDGTIVADGTVAVVGTNTDFESTSNGNRPLLATGSKVYINDIKYEVATITDDTNLTLTTIVPAGTYEVEMDSFIGDKEYVSCMAYNNGGNVNWAEGFDGVEAALSQTTSVTREGANIVIRKGEPYIEASGRAAWTGMVTDMNMSGLEDWQVNHAIGACARVPVTTYESDPMAWNGEQQTYTSDMQQGATYQAGVVNKGTPGSNRNVTELRNYRGRIYLRATHAHYVFIGLTGDLAGVQISKYMLDQTGLVNYDSNQTFSIDPNTTVTASTNNTKINKLYSTANLWNPFVATDEIPILQSFVDLSSEITKSGANALHLYHIWGESPDNASIQKYLGRDNSLNPQTAYASVYNIPFPLTQDLSKQVIGNHRQYYPYISMDMHISKLDPCVTVDISSSEGRTAFGGSGAVYTSDTYVDGQTPNIALNDATFGSAASRMNTETFLRSVVVTFSNYKPTDDMKTLDEFLNYGLDNFYTSTGSDGDINNSGRIVGGICMMKYGMNPSADIDAGFIYAQALPVMTQQDGTTGVNAPYQMAHVVSGSGDGQLRQLIMRPTDLTNAAETPRTVELPMAEWFNIKTFIDVFAKNGENSADRNPYGNAKGDIGGESSGIGMRVMFDMESTKSGSAGSPSMDNLPYLDLKFPYSPTAKSSQGPGTGDDGYLLSETYSYGSSTVDPTFLYPNIMTIWVQNYRFTKDSEVFFVYGDNNIVSTPTNGGATEAEVFIDNINMVDFYQSFSNVSSKANSISSVSFPQRRTSYNPCQEINPLTVGTVRMTSFNPGTGSTEGVDMKASLAAATPASYINIGLNNRNDLPISGSATSRRGYFLMNGFYTPDPNGLDQLIPDLYSGSFISQSATDVTTDSNNNCGYQFVGSNYASGSYSDPATGSSMYDVTGSQNVTSKINITTGSNDYMASDGFTQKGAFMASISGTQFTNWSKRENPLTSAKVIAVPNATNGLSITQIRVENTSFININDNRAEYVLYTAGSEGSSSSTNKGFRVLTLKDNRESVTPDGILTFASSVTNTSGGHMPLAVEGNLSRLYISPYQYWITLMTKGVTNFANRTYSSVCLLGNNLSGATVSNIQGTTFDEVEYTYDSTRQTYIGESAPYYQKWAFDMDPDTETAIQLNVNYGYGTWNPDENKGGAVSRRVVQSGSYVNLDISSLVTSPGVGPDGDFNLVLKMPHDSLGTNEITLYGDEYTGTSSRQYKPTFIYEYSDRLPLLGGLSVFPAFNLLDKAVNPYKLTDANLNALKFTWTEDGGDVWYRMLMINENAAIPNKYTNAKLWLPLNEEPTNLAVKATHVAYNMTNNTSGNCNTGDAVLSYIDGMSGYSPELIAETSTVSGTVSVPNATNNALHGLAEYTLVTHVVFDSTMAGVACDILKQSGSTSELISLHKNSSNQIVYTHHSTTATTTTGSNFIVCDGKTPYSIIINYKYQSEAGPDIQLYINGNRSSYALTAAGALNASTSLFTIAPSGAVNKFKGRIEEVVLYNKKYEIISNPAEYVFSTADLADNASSKSINWSARLFNFDYHNIRGKTLNDVARSNEVNWGATTL